MTDKYLDKNSCETIQNKESYPIEIPAIFPFLARLKNGIWYFGIPSWLFGITDRGVAAFADGYLSPIEVLHLLTASFFFISWLCLKPDEDLMGGDHETEKGSSLQLNSEQQAGYLGAAQARMLELQEYHMISQEYILPYPYICQLYHLLNLKHLEKVHSFSLNNLRVVKVSHFEPTAIGGVIKFETTLDSPMNALRIWRQPIVEVELVLHTPYTVELRIPVYNDKKMIVMFNVLPLSDHEHKLFIDIYSTLDWPKPLLQSILHFSSCLTLFEDLPYLHRLAERKLERLISRQRVSQHETMLLFKRFVELYGSSITPAPSVKALPSSEEKVLIDAG